MSIQQMTSRLMRCEHDQAAQKYLSSLSDFYNRYQTNIAQKLEKINKKPERTIHLGTTSWNYPVEVPTNQMLFSHGLILGATGSGKSYYSLNFFKKAIEQEKSGFGIIDPKRELYLKAVNQLVIHLNRLNPTSKEQLIKKLYIIDYANPNTVVPYNILAPRIGESVEALVHHRVDTICDLFTGSSTLTTRMRITLKYFLYLLAENKLPITFFDYLCDDFALISTLARKSKNDRVRRYYLKRFKAEAKSTIYALRQRIDSLVTNESVRLSLSASTAPDFRKLMDDEKIVLITTSNPGISRETSHTLQMFLLSDITQAVFQRKRVKTAFNWQLDEAQWLYKHRSSRSNINELLSMSRSFGTYFWLLTQSLSSAVTDSEIRNAIECNVKNILMLRSTPSDARILLPALPITGTMQKLKTHPLEPNRYLDPKEEIKARTEEIPRLPDRVGYLWLKTMLGEAIRIKTPFVGAGDKSNRIGRKEYLEMYHRIRSLNAVPKGQILKEIKEKERHLETISQTVQQKSETKSYNNTEALSDMISVLEQNYHNKRGQKSEMENVANDL